MTLIRFQVADRTCAIDIAQALEVIRLRNVVPVSDSAGAVKGMLHLRGRLISLIGLREKLGLPGADLSPSNRVIVSRGGAGTVAGFVVDAVHDVVSLEAGEILPPDDLLRDVPYLAGVGEVDGTLFPIIDLEALWATVPAPVGGVEAE